MRISVRRVATDERAYRAIVEAVHADSNGELDDVERALVAYEQRHGMTTGDARAALARGELRPTLEIEGWMMALRVRDHLVKATS